ncbi:NADH dehydrogenase [ubiquinone] 1 alpha subcomplex subunit 9, mitochondrial [Anthonomus grandis grandis]|uniref:NADH dehydrogenase [ubiquinone] 1 alpha subcomplex subunit 9, mitochondrial n=1 Tax=Anthonomus grandis grandis TaxID=2921223 RepID=UPI0021669025|nr:NADH dehydrogenase [ubiquinone] 1 alpha subcomplex subunit 9, mitochondrial [Anthonomus grandis grandis]
MSGAMSVSLRAAAQPRLGLVAISYNHSRTYSTEDADYTNISLYKRGTGGRSSFNGVVATVFGCTGFIGRYVCNRLGKIGSQLILPYRGDSYDPMRLKLVGDLGQVYFHHYNLRDEESIHKVMKYSNVVINLVGRDWETRNFSYNDVHVDGARRLARIAKESGVSRFIHVSALNVLGEPQEVFLKGGSRWLKSKALGECAVLEEFPQATIFRPTDVYGQEDRFLRYYMHNWRRQFQNMPLWENGEKTEKQPVHVSDLAAGIVAAIKDPDSAGKIYQAYGPKRYLLSELVDYFYRITQKGNEQWGFKRYNMKYDLLFKLKVSLTEKFSPNWPIGHLHWERLEREHVSDNVNAEMLGLQDLGINLTTMEEQVPWELRPWIYGLYYGFDADDPLTPAEPPKAITA